MNARLDLPMPATTTPLARATACACGLGSSPAADEAPWILTLVADVAERSAHFVVKLAEMSLRGTTCLRQ